MMRASFILLGVVCGVHGASVESYHDNNAQCDCYEIDAGGDPAYFHNFRFYDFSHETNSTTDFTTEPALVTTPGGTESTTSTIFDSEPFTKDWAVQNWELGPSSDGLLPRYNSPQNVYFMQTNASDMGTADSTATTFLRLRASKNSDFYSIGEIENTQSNMLYGSLRFYARVSGSSGTCGGMFLYASSVEETDIEILTKNSGKMFYSNQPDTGSDGNTISGATTIVSPSGFDFSQWHEHRIDWTPDMTWWYLDGVLVANTTYHVPTVPMVPIINMWSDGGVWTGDMPKNGVAKLDIQWMQAAFNTSGPKRGRYDKRFLHPSNERRATTQCTQVCKIDGVSKLGYPELGTPSFNLTINTGTGSASSTTSTSTTSPSSTTSSANSSGTPTPNSSTSRHNRNHARFAGLHAAAAGVANSALKFLRF